MIDDKIVKSLNSSDPERRKQAVKALARTKDPEALKYLATLVKTDSDPEVVDLARKAGAFIKKSMPAAASEPGIDSRLMDYDEPEPEAEVYPKMGEDDEPLPEEIIVSESDIARGQMYVEQALGWHIKENNDKAAQLLAKAFKINPKLRSDGYTTGLAATITGLSTPEAIKLLSPSAAELRKRVARSKASDSPGPAAQGSSVHRLLTILMLVGVLALIIGYIAMPWVDLSSAEVTEAGATMSIGQMMGTMKQMTAQMEGAIPDDFKGVVDAINGLKWKVSGLDATLLTTGLSNALNVTGASAFIDEAIRFEEKYPGTLDLASLNVSLEDIDRASMESSTLSYSMLLILLVIVMTPVIALALLLRGGFSTALWIFAIALGLIGLVPFWWFYSSALNPTVEYTVESAFVAKIFDQVIVSNTGSYLGIGYWIALIGQLAILFLPFFALMIPARQTQEAEAI